MDERSDTQLQEWAFGRKLGADFWGTDTWATVAILFYRLHRHREWITTDPSIADLFVMPLVPASPEYRTATKHPEDFKVATKTMCDHIFHDQLDLAYHYLNEESAPRHVFCAVEYTPVLAFCAMAGYSRKPASHRLLSRMRWFIHEDFELSRSAPLAYYSSLGLPGSQPVTAVNIPFPSGAAHSVSTLRQEARGNRPYLLSFVGSLNGSPEGRAIRTEISRQCATAGSPACHTLQIRAGMDLASSGATAAYELKRQSVFCAEPGGHNRIRKGVVDALLCGCIPVVFLRRRESRRLWPHHLFGWRNESMILLRPSRFLGLPRRLGQGRAAEREAYYNRLVSSQAAQGNTLEGAHTPINLVELLRQIPPARIAAMQRTIASNAHRLAYMVDDEPGVGDDALDVTLKSLAFGLPG